MSLDYPEYEELRNKSKLLRLLWRVGDIGYYVGLVGAVISPLAVIGNQVMSRKAQLSLSRAIMVGIMCTAFCLCLFGFLTA